MTTERNIMLYINIVELNEIYNFIVITFEIV